MSEHSSDVARLRQQIETATEAAHRALRDYRAVASHQAIIARMQRGSERLLHLIAQGHHEEAQALMETDWWVLDAHETSDSDKA